MTVVLANGTTVRVAFARDAIGLVVRRLPQPLPGPGAIAVVIALGHESPGLAVELVYVVIILVVTAVNGGGAGSVGTNVLTAKGATALTLSLHSQVLKRRY